MLADDGARPLRVGTVDLAAHAMSVEHDIGEIAHCQAIPRPVDAGDTLFAPESATACKFIVEHRIGMTARAQHHCVAGKILCLHAAPAWQLSRNRLVRTL